MILVKPGGMADDICLFRRVLSALFQPGGWITQTVVARIKGVIKKIIVGYQAWLHNLGHRQHPPFFGWLHGFVL
jgi:hypothetical protein